MKKNTLLIQLIVILLLNIFSHAYANNYPTKISLIVVGEDGISIANANVLFGFDTDKSVFYDGEGIGISGLTNDVGMFTGSSNSNSFVGYRVKKDGYYPSSGSHSFSKKNFAGWQPWNQTVEVLLRKIENPVPMHVRNTLESQLELPVANKNVGFDLIKFDWVIPYGQGTISDFVFHLKRPPFISRDNYDATLTITFNNKFDGIQTHIEKLKDGSQLKLPRYAPESGYQDKLVLHESFGAKGPVTQNFKFRADDLSYIFRVRSSEKGGKIERAMYGKILGYIDFSAMESNTAKIFMKYYLNPDYTRNLEFDPKRNLFGTLPDLERVTEP